MKVTYRFVTGDVEVEVADEWGLVALEQDRQQRNNDRRAHSWNVSMDMLADELGTQFVDPHTAEPPAFLDRLQDAISLLRPDQKDLMQAIYFDGMSVNEYARYEGVHPSAISHRLRTIERKIQKIFSDPQF